MRNNFRVQLIPNLVSIETNVRKINCFSFWDKEENKDFFRDDPRSEFEFKYFVQKKVESLSRILITSETFLRKTLGDLFLAKMYYVEAKKRGGER